LATIARHGAAASLAKYAQEYVRMTGATVALTHIDNNPDFYLLKDACSGLTVISAQNGARDDTTFNTFEKYAQNGARLRADHITFFVSASSWASVTPNGSRAGSSPTAPS
jgi:surface carbohydrate biosynthesis protein